MSQQFHNSKELNTWLQNQNINAVDDYSILNIKPEGTNLVALHATSPLPKGHYTVSGSSTVYISDGTYLRPIGGGGAISAYNKDKYISLTSAIRKTLHNTSNTRILFAGDSTTVGLNETPGGEILHSYPEQLSEILNKQVSQAGYQNHYGRDGNNGITAFNTYDTRMTNLPAGWVEFASNDAIGGTALFNSTTVNPITFAPNVQTDSGAVYYLDVTGYDPFVVKVGATTVGTATITGSNSIKKVAISTTLGANTYTIQRAGTGTNAIILGWEFYNSAQKEISCINAGVGGTFIDTWLAKTPTQWWSTLNSLTQAASTVKFDAVVINFGINHWANPATRTAADFKTALTLAVSTLDAAGIPVILVTPPPSPVSVATAATQQEYITAIYSVATTYNLAVIDVYNAWKADWTYGYANGWYRGNLDVHPSRLGYSVIAGYFASFFKELLA